MNNGECVPITLTSSKRA